MSLRTLFSLCAGGDLAGEEEHRDAVLVRVAQRRHHVRHPGAAENRKLVSQKERQCAARWNG